MLDYEEYGSNFRTPRALRPDGGPATNGTALDPNAAPEGRPPAPTTQQPQPGMQPPSAPAPVPQQTFTQMQQMGLPRPPAPTPSYDPSGAPGSLQNDIYSQYQKYATQTPMAAPNAQYTSPGAVTPRYTDPGSAPGSRYTGQFQGDPSSQQMNPQIQQAIMAALGNPSRYDAGVVKDSFGYLSGAIDDDYNQRDNRLQESMASRGLGAVGDGSIYGSNQINQNLMRRSAKQNLASELLREQANTYGQDRASALASAMGWGGQQFGQALQGFGANMGANAQNFGQDMDRAQFGLGANAQNFGQNLASAQYGQGVNAQNFGQDMDRAQFGLGAQGQAYNQQRGALQDYTNFGQNQYDNQYRTAQMNQQQQYQQMQMLMQLMGYGG